MQPNTKRACVFCGAEAGLTREHVYPQWVYDFIPVLTGHLNVTHLPMDVSQDPIPRARPIEKGHRAPKSRVVVRRFCGRCNSRWMSKAESRAKALIAPMLSAEKPSFVFSEQESYALAHWAALKIVVAANALGLERSNLDPGVYYDLKRGAIPYGFFVEVGEVRSPDVNSFFGPVTIWQAKEPDRVFAGELAAHSYIGCYQVGRLVFRASFVPSHPRVTRVHLVHETTLLHPYGVRVPFEAHDRGVGVDLDEFLSFGISLGICVDYHLTRFGRQWLEVA